MTPEDLKVLNTDYPKRNHPTVRLGARIYIGEVDQEAIRRRAEAELKMRSPKFKHESI